MKTLKYVSKPLEVEAVQVVEDDIYEIAKWCEGEVRKSKDGAKVIKVDVINPHADMLKEAEVGFWILKSERGFKVYTEQAFNNSFVPAKEYGKVKIVSEPST